MKILLTKKLYIYVYVLYEESVLKMLSKEMIKFMSGEKYLSKSMKNTTPPKQPETKPIFYLILKNVRNN